MEVGYEFQYDNSDYLKRKEKEIELLKEEIKLTEQLKKVTGEAIKDSGQTKVIQDTVKEIDKLNDKVESTKEATERARSGIKDWTRDLKVGNTTLGEASDKVKGWIASLTNSKKAIKENIALSKTQSESVELLTTKYGANSKRLLTIAKSANVVKLALAATGIGALLLLLGSLATALTKSQKGMNFLAQAGAVVSSVIGNITDRAVNLVSSLKTLYADGFGAFVSQAKESFTDLNEFIEDGTKAFNLEGQFIALKKEQADLRVEYAQTRATIEQLKLTAEDDTKSAKERGEALKKLAQQEDDLETKRLDILKRKLKITQEQNSLSESTAEDLQKERDLQIEIAEVEEETNGRRLEYQSTARGIEGDRLARLKEQADAIQKLRDEFQGLNDDLNSDISDLDLLESDPVERLNKQRQIALKGLEKSKDKIVELAKELGNPTDEIEAKFDRIAANIQESFNRQIDVIEIEPLIQVRPKTDNTIPQGAKDAVNDLLEEIGKGISSDPIAIPDLRVDFENIDFGDFETSDFDKLRDGLQDVIENVFTPENLENIETINTSLQSVFDGQIEGIDRVIEAREKEIESLEAKLNKQQDLADKGKNNNLNGIKEQLAEEQRLLEEAEAKKAALRKKSLIAQLIADSASQASSFATSLASLIDTTSKTPLPFPANILAVGAVIAQFFALVAGIKGQLSQINSLYTGGSLSDHLPNGLRSSGVIKKGFSNDRPGRGKGLAIEGTNIRVGGDEFLVNDKTAMANSRFLEAFNSDMYNGIDLKEMADFAAKRGYTSMTDITKSLRQPMALPVYTPIQSTLSGNSGGSNGITAKQFGEIGEKHAKMVVKAIDDKFESTPYYDKEGKVIGVIMAKKNHVKKVEFVVK